ncbi:MAG: hypothetical protein Fues2KO_32790 [Fuerstiella sp.]
MQDAKVYPLVQGHQTERLKFPQTAMAGAGQMLAATVDGSPIEPSSVVEHPVVSFQAKIACFISL